MGAVRADLAGPERTIEEATSMPESEGHQNLGTRTPPINELARTEAASAGDALLLTIPDVARLTNSGRSSVYEWIAKGWLPTVKIGRSVRVRRADLDRWIAGLSPDAA